MKKLSLIALLALGLAACGEATEEAKNIVEPQFGPGDSLRSIAVQIPITFGDVVTTEFHEDLTFHGYRFKALETAEFNIEITQLGTSRDLDTTLFLYGRATDGSYERIAFDDDSGWGKQSRLRNMTPGEFTELVAVVGTADSMGRGKYRLILECTNGACAPQPPTFDSCNDEIYPIFDECVEAQLENADWGWDDPAEAMSIEYCVEEGVFEEIEYFCHIDSPEAYCQAEPEAIEAVAPDCETRLKNDYAVYDSIQLDDLPLTEAIQEQADLLADYHGGGASTRLEGYRVATDVTTAEIAETLRQEHSYSSRLSTGDIEDRDTFRERRYLPTEVLDVIEDEYGTAYNATIISGSYYVAAGAEEWTTINVVHYRDNGVVFAITQVSGE